VGIAAHEAMGVPIDMQSLVRGSPSALLIIVERGSKPEPPASHDWTHSMAALGGDVRGARSQVGGDLPFNAAYASPAQESSARKAGDAACLGDVARTAYKEKSAVLAGHLALTRNKP